MYQIFLVEDDKTIRTQLELLLKKYHYDCYVCENFEDVVGEILFQKPHLVLLDINLPVLDGYQVCRELRRRSNVPIIVVTSRNSDLDELMSMNLGADDFIAKPYHTQILLAHISALLSRAYQQEQSSILTYRTLTLNLSKGEASIAGQTVELTRNELRILHLFLKNPGRIISRNEIMNELWQSNEFVDDNTLTVNINRLRKKLAEIGGNEYLTTKRGQGYIL